MASERYVVMRIPGAERAIIPREKIVDYLLDLDHPDGGPKARLLASLGFDAARPEEFETAMRSQHLTAEAQSGRPSPFGQKYEVTATLDGPVGRIVATSVWIVLVNEDCPRLVTLVPRRRMIADHQ